MTYFIDTHVNNQLKPPSTQLLGRMLRAFYPNDNFKLDYSDTILDFNITCRTKLVKTKSKQSRVVSVVKSDY